MPIAPVDHNGTIEDSHGRKQRSRPMSTPTSRQVRKRKVVAEALERHKVFVSSRRFKAGEEPTYRVIVANEAYQVGQRTLDQLNKGYRPGDLGLEPLHEEAGE